MTREERLFVIAWSVRRSALFTIRRRGIRPADEHDVLQLVMLHVWQRLQRGEFTEGEDELVRMRRWIAGLASNTARVYRRKTPPQSEPFEDNVGGLDLAGRIESREILKLTFARLNRVETTLMLGVMAGETLDEMGARTRMPAGTVATKIRAVRRVLRQRSPR